jgi:hypothetical protein
MCLQEKQKLTAEQQQLLKQILNYSYEVRLSYMTRMLSCAAGELQVFEPGKEIMHCTECTRRLVTWTRQQQWQFITRFVQPYILLVVATSSLLHQLHPSHV